jgi:hypothetical protein
MFTLLNTSSEVVATANLIFYDNQQRGWQVEGGTLFSDPNMDLYSLEGFETGKQVSPVEFMLLFKSPERIAIKAARPTDPVIDDFMDIVEDPRLTFVDLGLQSTKDALDYFVFKTILTPERKDEILAGQVQ